MRSLQSPVLLAFCCVLAACSGSPSAGPEAAGTATPAASGGVGFGSTPGATPLATATPSLAASAAPPAPAPTPAGAYAPLNAPGPALDVPPAALSASLTCPSSIANTSQSVVLLVPGTDTIPSVDFDWNYELAFTQSGTPWCALTLPYSATGDIQTAGEYVVNAIRTIFAASGHKVHVLGWSQGGMVPRWALRFWPDTRAMVDDLVSLDASNHGTILADGGGDDTPADWQQAADSNFIAALNSSTETFAGIDYTQIFSYSDEIVIPNSPVASSSSLSVGPGTIANIAVQQICPTDTSEHLAMGTYDAVGYALVVDAFAKGVAAAGDISPAVCAEPYQPAVVPASFASNYAAFVTYTTGKNNHAPTVTSEPTAAPYVFAP